MSPNELKACTKAESLPFLHPAASGCLFLPQEERQRARYNFSSSGTLPDPPSPRQVLPSGGKSCSGLLLCGVGGDSPFSFCRAQQVTVWHPTRLPPPARPDSLAIGLVLSDLSAGSVTQRMMGSRGGDERLWEARGSRQRPSTGGLWRLGSEAPALCGYWVL
jgi:hypothetical protein